MIVKYTTPSYTYHHASQLTWTLLSSPFLHFIRSKATTQASRSLSTKGKCGLKRISNATSCSENATSQRTRQKPETDKNAHETPPQFVSCAQHSFQANQNTPKAKEMMSVSSIAIVTPLSRFSILLLHTSGVIGPPYRPHGQS